jgi:hypothetical protein
MMARQACMVFLSAIPWLPEMRSNLLAAFTQHGRFKEYGKEYLSARIKMLAPVPIYQSQEIEQLNINLISLLVISA